MSLPLKTLELGIIPLLLGTFLACGSRPPLDVDDGGMGTGATGGSGGTTGGSGATGGSSTGATGGSGGSPGTGATGGTGGTGGMPSCGCTTAWLKWGMSGGLSPSRDESELYSCKTFVLTRQTINGVTTACKQEISDCSNAVGAGDVANALAHPDVQSALAARAVLYGRDTRPVDGQVLVINVGNSRIEIGLPCEGTTTQCLPIPPGVQSLADLLTTMQKQQLARPPCSTLPPAP